jgi:hypothetical protein
VGLLDLPRLGGISTGRGACGSSRVRVGRRAR